MQVELEVTGVTSCELYPSPLPDLFTGLPLLVTGRFTGVWPATVVLRGLLPDGKRYSQKVQDQRSIDLTQSICSQACCTWHAAAPRTIAVQLVSLRPLYQDG